MLWYLISSGLLIHICNADFLEMSPEEKRIAKKTWATFTKFPKVGEAILFEALQMNPDAKKQFKTFTNVPLGLLKADPTFQAQGKKTLAAVTKVVEDLDNEEELVSFLKEIGQMHKRRKVPAEDFKTFHLAVVHVMKSSLGTALSESAEGAVSKLMKKMVQRITQEYENHNEAE